MKYLTDVKDVKIYSLSELITFFREKNIPCEKIRFFVNEDRKDPKCFGIYQDKDTGNFIVYKTRVMVHVSLDITEVMKNKLSIFSLKS